MDGPGGNNVEEILGDESSSSVLHGASGARVDREVCHCQDAPGSFPPAPVTDSGHFIPRSDGFDMIAVAYNFEMALTEPDARSEVAMDHYIQAYRELERFFELMGTIFGFVGADVKDKLDILSKHRSGAEGANYRTIRSMMVFETAEPSRLEPTRTPQISPLPSASRTLLRLHRALEFIMMFMESLIGAPDCEGVGHLAQDCYKKTLARYHGWLVQKGAHLAMYTLPTKYRLMERISKHPYSEVTDIARRMTEAMRPVFDRTQELYTEFKLHDLP